MIPMADLEAAVDDWITGHPTFEIAESRIIHGNGNARQLASVGQELADLTEEHYVRRIVRDNFHEIMARLQTEYDRLAGTERETDRIVKLAPDAISPKSGYNGTKAPDVVTYRNMTSVSALGARRGGLST